VSPIRKLLSSCLETHRPNHGEHSSTIILQNWPQLIFSLYLQLLSEYCMCSLF